MSKPTQSRRRWGLVALGLLAGAPAFGAGFSVFEQGTKAMGMAGAFTGTDAQSLSQAHAVFVAEGLTCTLDRRPRWVMENEPIAAAREAVRTSLRVQGLVFDPGSSGATTL